MEDRLDSRAVQPKESPMTAELTPWFADPPPPPPPQSDTDTAKVGDSREEKVEVQKKD